MDYLRNLLKAASRIDLIDVKRGKYFRIIATVKADGEDVVPLMIEKGMGRPYPGGKRRGWCGALNTVYYRSPGLIGLQVPHLCIV